MVCVYMMVSMTVPTTAMMSIVQQRRHVLVRENSVNLTYLPMCMGLSLCVPT